MRSHASIAIKQAESESWVYIHVNIILTVKLSVLESSQTNGLIAYGIPIERRIVADSE